MYSCSTNEELHLTDLPDKKNPVIFPGLITSGSQIFRIENLEITSEFLHKIENI